MPTKTVVQQPEWWLVEGNRINLCVPRQWPFPASTCESLLQTATAELIGLVGHFGFPFAQPVRLYVFPSSKWLSAFFGNAATGVALLKEASIAIGGDLADPVPTIRHEMAHLFSGAWGTMDPALKSEGLAVWWEHRHDAAGHEKQVATRLREHVLAGRPHRVFDLLDPVVFFAPRDTEACYDLAGGFTRWLIDTFGWVRYREFFNRATSANFGEMFEKKFDMRVCDAEKGWHRNVMGY